MVKGSPTVQIRAAVGVGLADADQTDQLTTDTEADLHLTMRLKGGEQECHLVIGQRAAGRWRAAGANWLECTGG